MKSYLLILGMIVFSGNIYAEESNKYIFGGFNFGVSTIDSTVQSETNNKNGSFYGATFGYEHKFKSKFNLNLGLDYNIHKVETDLSLTNFSKVYLESKYLMLTLNPTYSINKKFDIGLKGSFAVTGDGILISQNENLQNLVGVNLMYNMNLKNNKVRFGLGVDRGSVNSDYTQVGAFVQYSFGLTKKNNKKVVQRKIKKTFYRTIDLSENLITFDHDSNKLSAKSKVFLAEIGNFLNRNNDMWEHLKIVGHTSLDGKEDYNEYLSYRRANSVFEVISEMGVNKKKVSLEGAGETAPLYKKAKNQKEVKSNRRVELKFIKLKNYSELKFFIDKLIKKHKMNQ